MGERSPSTHGASQVPGTGTTLCTSPNVGSSSERPDVSVFQSGKQDGFESAQKADLNIGPPSIQSPRLRLLQLWPHLPQLLLHGTKTGWITKGLYGATFSGRNHETARVREFPGGGYYPTLRIVGFRAKYSTVVGGDRRILWTRVCVSLRVCSVCFSLWCVCNVLYKISSALVLAYRVRTRVGDSRKSVPAQTPVYRRSTPACYTDFPGIPRNIIFGLATTCIAYLITSKCARIPYRYLNTSKLMAVGFFQQDVYKMCAIGFCIFVLQDVS